MCHLGNSILWNALLLTYFLEHRSEDDDRDEHSSSHPSQLSDDGQSSYEIIYFFSASQEPTRFTVELYYKHAL